jgi:hypothetical protein
VRAEILNTTDWNEARWKDCRFYLSKGEGLMHVADPEKDKRSSFEKCVVLNLDDACGTANLAVKAKITASSESVGFEASKANDAKTDSAWKAQGATDQWLQIEFSEPTAINEFKIKEDPSSSINRYVIEAWDDKASRWVSCFNGGSIAAEFVAPIVGRTTNKVRLFIKKTAKDNPSIVEFEAYNNTSAGLPYDERGNPVRAKP